MDTPRNFRAAFHGFNREDVVHYLEFINAKHQSQVNQLTAELESLRAAQVPEAPSEDPLCDELAAQLEASQARCNELAAELAMTQAEADTLRARCEDLEAQSTPEKSAAELETYRRAERTEREARDRAELTYFQANSVLTEATAKVDQIAAEITEMADDVMSQLTQLQVAVSGSKHALQDAAAIMHSIRPNQ